MYPMVRMPAIVLSAPTRVINSLSWLLLLDNAYKNYCSIEDLSELVFSSDFNSENPPLKRARATGPAWTKVLDARLGLPSELYQI